MHAMVTVMTLVGVSLQVLVGMVILASAVAGIKSLAHVEQQVYALSRLQVSSRSRMSSSRYMRYRDRLDALHACALHSRGCNLFIPRVNHRNCVGRQDIALLGFAIIEGSVNDVALYPDRHAMTLHPSSLTRSLQCNSLRIAKLSDWYRSTRFPPSHDVMSSLRALKRCRSLGMLRELSATWCRTPAAPSLSVALRSLQ